MASQASKAALPLITTPQCSQGELKLAYKNHIGRLPAFPVASGGGAVVA